MSTIQLTFLLLSCVVCIQCHSYYRERIPNGKNVPNPCAGEEGTWEGVGHNRKQGGGSRNIFGQEFAANKHEWSEELCKKDSDGDGRTNGEELGDPDCIWSKGKTPQTGATGHPGVCEPMEDEKCKTINADILC